MKDKRDEKGRFKKGVSGNPSGKCKNGSIPQQDAPLTEAREIVELSQAKDPYRVQQRLKEIMLDNAEDLLNQAITKAKQGNERILAILLAGIAPKIDEGKPKQEGPNDRRQLELELFEELKASGWKIKDERKTVSIERTQQEERKEDEM